MHKLVLVVLLLSMPALAADHNQKLKSLGIPVPELVRLPAGRFIMGTEGSEPAERPAHRVSVSSFWIGKTEVTVEQFAAFVAETGYKTEAERGDKPGGWVTDPDLGMARKDDANWRNPYMKQDGRHPVVLVTATDAEAYAAWLAKKSGLRVALPTEAQWEYAARAGTVSDFAGPLSSIAWTKEDSGGVTHPVAAKYPNPWGLFDMHGNAWEWTADWYSDYTHKWAKNPVVTEDQKRGRVIRGGSFAFPHTYARSTFRQEGHGASARAHDTGFRVVVNPDPN